MDRTSKNNRLVCTIAGVTTIIGLLILAFDAPCANSAEQEGAMFDIDRTTEQLRHHVRELSVTIGERSVYEPENLEVNRIYIIAALKATYPSLRQLLPRKD